jgi:hypothetical protein
MHLPHVSLWISCQLPKWRVAFEIRYCIHFSRDKTFLSLLDYSSIVESLGIEFQSSPDLVSMKGIRRSHTEFLASTGTTSWSGPISLRAAMLNVFSSQLTYFPS